jgi:hypothetical protein
MDPQSIINVYHSTMKEAIGLTVAPTVFSTLIHYTSKTHARLHARTHSADPSHSQTDSHHTPHSEDTYCLSHLPFRNLTECCRCCCATWCSRRPCLLQQVRDSLSIVLVLVLSLLDPKHSFFPLLIAESV